MHHRKSFIAISGIVLLQIAMPATLRWGEVGHRIAGELAAEKLPAEMPAFFRAAKARLGYLNPEPDRWRDGTERRTDTALDLAFAPDHFIDLELIPTERQASVFRAPSRYAFIDSLRALGLQPAKVGFSPFAMLELTQRLRSDFRRWRTETDSARRTWIEQRIIDDAGVLGHYVTDGSNPAHTTIHFNGWSGSNPNGYATDLAFHGRFESGFVGARIADADVRAFMTGGPRTFTDVRSAILEYVRASNGEVEHLYRLDKAVPFDSTNTSLEHKRFAAERLAIGATMLRDLWWTAWVTSN